MTGKKEFFDLFASKTSYFILGGVSLAVAMQWNTTIREGLEEYLPRPSKTFTNVLYSIIITIILVLLILTLSYDNHEMSRPDQEITQLQIKRMQHDNILLRQRLSRLENKAPGY